MGSALLHGDLVSAFVANPLALVAVVVLVVLTAGLDRRARSAVPRSAHRGRSPDGCRRVAGTGSGWSSARPWRSRTRCSATS